MTERKTHVRVRYAQGYLMLGMLADAASELARIPREDDETREVMEARLDLATQRRTWKTAVRHGEQLATRYPEIEAGWIGWAYALRELQKIEEAKGVLLEAEPRHGKKSALLHFNLACYYALLGEVDTARERLARACKLDARFKDEALTDPDLASVRP